VRGSVDLLQGQSDFLFNMAVFYEQGPFRARASYAHIGEATTSVSATDVTGLSDRIDDATNTVDVQARYALANGVELIAEVRNLTDEIKVNRTGNGVYRDVSFYGRQFWIGASAKF
ncbi:MAG: TonB-dependent receptor, partial [Caulobacteraceae bacterium]|nr:TonB-dependent receptor [Caulobacteraceae bacterium]